MFAQVSALSIDESMPPVGDTGLFFGQNHSYTVVFRGNGEAIVFGRMVITNTQEEELSKFVFEIPKVTPTELVILQQQAKPVCIQYDYQKPYDAVTRQYPCLQYQESVDYYGGNYAYPYYGPSEYQKVKYSQSGTLYSLALPTPIQPGKTGSIIFSYAAFGYASQTAGLFKFNFETPKVASRISLMRVAVDVDSDLFLKGKKSQVNYNLPSQEAFSLAMPAGKSLANPTLDSLSSSIGNYGSIVKEAKSLAPNESLMVKGEYASSRARLYIDSIVWTLVIVAVILFAIWKLRRQMAKRKKTEAVFNAENQNLISILNFTNASMGFLSAVLVVVLTYLIKILARSDFFQYLNDEFLGIMVVVMIGLLYVLVVFGPAVLVGAKHGAKAGISVLIAEFLWFVLLLLLFVLLFNSGLTDAWPKPMPYVQY